MQKETFELANQIIDWHAAKIGHLQGLLAAIEASPDGVTLQGPDGNPLELTPAQVEAFVVGVGIAIMELEELPFQLVRGGEHGEKPH